MAAAVALVCGLPSVAAAQHIVNTTVDHAPDGCQPLSSGDCTIRDAIADPSAVEVQIPAGEYELTQGELVVGRDLIIRGTGVELPTIRPDEELSHRVLRIEEDWGLQLSRVRIAGGRVRGGSGGGIFVDADAILTLTDAEVSGNRASRGGGIWAIGSVSLERSLVAGNVAEVGPDGQEGYGGGIGLDTGSAGLTSARLVSTTVSGNSASHLGGGIFTRRSMSLENVSIVSNTAPPRGPENIGKGGGLYQQFPSGSGLRTSSSNVLVARNVNGGCGGTAGEFFIDSDNGLIDEPLPNTTCNAVGADNLIVPDALIGPLADNGGPTRTHELLAGSPAIDAGTECQNTDQRGYARPIAGDCDIGAVETGHLDVNVFTDDSAGGCTVAHCTLREAVEAAVDGTVITLDAGTYVLDDAEPLLLDENVKIVGPGARVTTIDANRTSRIGFVLADVEISGVTVRGGDANAGDNGAEGFGGAFYVSGSTELTLRQTALVDNIARFAGGAVANEGTFRFIESLATNNRVRGNNPANGGAIWSAGLGTTVSNSTLSGNTADPDGVGNDTRGGGLYVVDASTIENSTITGNSAEEGAGFYDASGNSTIVGTIIAGNPGGPQCDDPSIATVIEHHNLASDMSCQFDAQGDRQGVDPLLGPLADNGGPTNTHALAGGSPAIDGVGAAFCPTTDQRLLARAPGACDIGAFDTSASPPSPPSGGGGNQQPPPDDDPEELPPPVAGKNVNAVPAGGTVKVKVKGSRRFVELVEGQQIPVGSEIDTRNGRVTIEAAGGSVATFYDGLFRFDQGKGAKPLTTLTLIEKLACPKSGKASAAAKKKKKRRLWGDGKGKFRTEGEFSSATVRGTIWLVEDRCDRTLTRVRQGRVAVRDKVKRKTVIVRAGKQYVAKKRK